MSDKAFMEVHPQASSSDVVKAINALSAARLIDLVCSPTGGLMYRAIKQEEAAM